MKAANDTEIARHYRAQRSRKIMLGKCVLSEKAERRRGEWKPSLELMRLREIEKIIQSRHGSMLPETDDADLYIEAAAFSRAEQEMGAWCRKWAPWAGPAVIEPILAKASKRRRMMRADGVAGLLMVTMKERDDLGLKTIGACDMSKGERIALVRERKRARDRKRMEQKRAGTKRKDRASYEAQSLSRVKPWDAEGMSRATWYRKQRETGASRVEINTNGDILVSTVQEYAPPMPLPSKQETGGVAGRWGSGSKTPAGCQGAEPHGRRDKDAAA